MMCKAFHSERVGEQVYKNMKIFMWANLRGFDNNQSPIQFLLNVAILNEGN